MISLDATDLDKSLRNLATAIVPLALGFLYWLIFLLVLEPGNMLRFWADGQSLPITHEALRIVGAALLGSAVTPILLAGMRRFPLLGADRWRHALIHLVGNILLAFALVVSSCFVAAWGFERQPLPSLIDVQTELAANWTLLVFALCAFTAIAHVLQFIQAREPVEITPAQPGSATRIAIKSGGRLRYIDIASIDWIETQGNYLALHAGSTMQLIRRTLTDFETDLDTRDFVRIHRRVIVAVKRIHDMQALTNGDANLRLLDGRELRVSRRYREAVRTRWAEQGVPE